MAFLVGIIVAGLLVALLANSIGVMVLTQWEDNVQGWAHLQWKFRQSGLRLYSQRVMSSFVWSFVPFFPGLPPVLMPQ
ncbi:MAG: hypothetical protein P1S60_14620 [Anaerolineae bacterium]|nr:hypothetical protein [Anaerolineae bacterium]